jgi:hypothetical protein
LTKGKEFNGTPHFGSLPQGERRDEIKDFMENLSPLPSPAGWRGEKKGVRGLKKNLLN